MSEERHMLTMRRLTAFSQVEALYHARLKKDFSRNERRPLATIRRSWERDAYDAYVLLDGEEILGYAFLVRLGNNYLFDYLAIAEEHRDEGLGSLFLSRLIDCLKDADCVVGEVEDPAKAEDADSRAQRERRLQFYLRIGCRETELTANVYGVDYRILELPREKPFTTNELREIYTALYRSIFSPRIFRTQFRIT
ncbi:MAG: GNAT family N-acetyltransferase [Oscillospiraceae bacterium]|nr:GNAT family N-acetyltransferase [Oscillospiraceae bacterium]MBO5640342.1 GNAT family N-acetyltransferase [Oscillospiraceae bacterium]